MLAEWVVEEAELLGVGAHGSLTTAGRLAVAGDLAAAQDALAERAPATVEKLLLQADLTVVAPGALRPQVAAELELLADVESRGAATVYRIGERSLRRAFDAGRSADEVLAFLAGHAAHGVPQALSYLVADIGRRHGQVRIGQARCYVRSDDAALVAELARGRALARHGLRVLAPTVLVADVEPATLLDALRDAGYLPVAEDGTGAVVISRPALRRAPARPSLATAGKGAGKAAPAVPRSDDVEAVVAALRRPAGTAVPKAAARKPAPKSPANGSRPSSPPLFLLDDDRPGAIAKAPGHVGELLKLACDGEWLARISYVNGRGDESQLNVAVLDVGPRKMLVSVLPSFNNRTLNVSRVQWARILTEAEEDQFL
jgi:hypothetical protein